jgi:acetyltransferase-like isoleucine patch superfamily enzyme
MIDPRCLGPDVDRAKISPDAAISGASYLTGNRTAVAAGAVVKDARLHDIVVETGARVVDSICVARGEPHSHRCDSAGRVVVSGCVPATVAKDADVAGSTLTNTSVGNRSLVHETSATDCTLGPNNSIRAGKLVLTETLAHVTVLGPTEISEARLGHHATIDRRGYFEGVFSNAFPQVRFDEAAKTLRVIGEIDLPHVSRYGANTINSTNSGKLLSQPDGILRSLGAHGGLWCDPLLSHEQIELGPCCWVAPWTKVVGQSGEPHEDDNALVNDRLTTYLMPFSIAGFQGELTRGLVMPGELSVGLGPKQRHGAWVFTYAPGAVISMVARLHAALPEDKKQIADTIVEEALCAAIEMTKAMAAEYGVDLTLPLDKQPRAGWPRWIGQTYALLRTHLDNQLWRFEEGVPCDWTHQSGQWRHPRLDAILALAPEASTSQWSEQDIFPEDDSAQYPVKQLQVVLPAGALDKTLAAGQGGRPGDALTTVHPEAKIAPGAMIAPGCRIGPGTVIEDGATVWRSALENCHVEANALVERSDLANSRVGNSTHVRSTRLVDSDLGDESSAEAALIERSRLASHATVSAFAVIRDVETEFGSILGSGCRHSRIRTNLMSMHLAGDMAHVEALPTPVTIDGKTVSVPAVPMIGGGALLRGVPESPIALECSFIGSNAVIEPGVRLGFGCFVLGRLAAGSGLPPFTLATDENPGRHQIGGVLGSMPSTIVTHFLSWAYQSVPLEMAPAVGQLARQSILRAVEAVEAELAGRETAAESLDHDYTSLANYTENQLKAGLANYRRSLASGAWDLVAREGSLHFVADRGHWRERSGSLLWKSNQ